MSDIAYIQDWEDNGPDETELQMRQREIRARLKRAQSRETVTAMIERYKNYGVDI